MIAALLFINQKGEVIIYRTYRDNFSRAVADTFRTQVCNALRAPGAQPMRSWQARRTPGRPERWHRPGPHR